MPTYYEVEFTERAKKDYERIIEYLLTNWNQSVAKQFILDIDKEIVRIKTFPFAFPVSYQKKDVRRCVMSNINTIYYTVMKHKIYIITIFDNRQEKVNL